LPIERTISPDGFEAHWQISHLGRSFPQFWNSQENNYMSFESDYFNVNLLLPIDFYQKVERSVKYGLLFILLTFTTFFLFEIFNPIRIHPFQYLMVGAALCIFYLLLLSISEHLNFSIAYLIASIATIGLITAYGKHVLISTRRALIMGASLVVLYVYLYILLHLQDYALLFGALGLFGILALVMYITRNIDWYNIDLNQVANKE
jgi:inner membrane protein